jgi:chemotaxis-related protein WspD
MNRIAQEDSMLQAAPEMPGATARIDDCWNRIGTRGDNSCPRLAEHSRCLNCPVFAHHAAALLDRPLSDAELASTQRNRHASDLAAREQVATHSALAFRIADEWLALPTHVLRQVDDIRPIHSLPHRRNRAVLGVVNVRGALTIAVSLGELLNMERAPETRVATRNTYARMLVAAHNGEPVAFPVDEVEGVVRFAESTLLPVPATLAHATAFHARGVLNWRDTTIGLLDADRLFDSIARSLR